MGILRNTIDVSLATYHYHVILRYLLIQSLDLADIRIHPIVFVCLRYLQVSIELDQKLPRKPLSLRFAYKSQSSQVHRQTFVRIRKDSDRSRGIANIRNMFLNSESKAYLQHILKQLQAILINNNHQTSRLRAFLKIHLSAIEIVCVCLSLVCKTPMLYIILKLKF